jgi:hypothetical protein
VLQIDSLEKKWAVQIGSRAFRCRMEITGEGLALGAETLLAKMAPAAVGGASGLVLNGQEQRILALLSVAYGRSVSVSVIGAMRKASEHWSRGDKLLSHIHLSYTGLPPFKDSEQAFRLFAADELLKAGIAPRILMEALGLDPAQLDLAQSYNPDQPRVPAGNGLESGRWTSGDNNSVESTGWNTTEQFQMAGIVEDLEAAMGGTPRRVVTPKGATQFIGPNGAILRFDIFPGQYGASGPHINLQGFPGAPGNIHIPVSP